MGVKYRFRQFWDGMAAAPSKGDLYEASKTLSPTLMALFIGMQTSEQAHSLAVYRQLRQQDEKNADLLIAALLHDVGKSCYPLRLWERVLIVIGRAMFPRWVKTWGQAEPRGWKRPYVVAEQHAYWGAEMAEQAGASPMTVKLIRRHQDPPSVVAGEPFSGEYSIEDRLLFQLQLIDNGS